MLVGAGLMAIAVGLFGYAMHELTKHDLRQARLNNRLNNLEMKK